MNMPMFFTAGAFSATVCSTMYTRHC